jgi:hypothetical protein
MTLFLTSLLLVVIGIIIIIYYKPTDNIKNFKDQDKFKEQLPVEHPEVEKLKVDKKPYKRKPQAKKK